MVGKYIFIYIYKYINIYIYIQNIHSIYDLDSKFQWPLGIFWGKGVPEKVEFH